MQTSSHSGVEGYALELLVELRVEARRPDQSEVDQCIVEAIERLPEGQLADACGRAWSQDQIQVEFDPHPLRSQAPAFRLLASSSLDLGRRQLHGALRIRAREAYGPRRPMLGSCIVVGQAIARLSRGRLVDPARRGLGGVPLAELQPRPDARVHVGQLICVPAAAGPGPGAWLTTLGMPSLGLPELEMRGVEASQVENAARLMAGVGQVLVEQVGEGFRVDRLAPAVTLCLRELQWALGLRPTPSLSGAREWTRVGLRPRQILADSALRVELVPPPGYRGGRRDWLAFALADLIGPPRGSRVRPRTSLSA